MNAVSLKQLVPRCDHHPSDAMHLVDAVYLDDAMHVGAGEQSSGKPFPVYRCSQPGCKRYFEWSLGYQTPQMPLTADPVRCNLHDERPHMVIQASASGYGYVCPIESCSCRLTYPKKSGERA